MRKIIGLCCAAWLALASSACGSLQKAASPALKNRIDRLGAALSNDETPELWRSHFIDVGQGLAVLQEFPCGAVLIDTGGEKDERMDSDVALKAYLDAFFARRTDLHNTLDLLVLTHPHIDHTRGVETVLEHYTVRNLVDNGQDFGSGAEGQRFMQAWPASHPGVNYRGVALADIASATGLTDAIIDPVRCPAVDPDIRVLWGKVAADPGWPGIRFGKTPFQNNNNHSVVVRIGFGKAAGLFTGDLEEPAIKDLLARTRGTSLLDVDLYQVGHHGSINGTLPELAEAMTPEVAVFACGPHYWQLTWSAWKYGHPRQEIVAMLEAVMTRKRKPIDVQLGVKGEVFAPHHLEAALYATAWDGAVVVEARADGRVNVLTSKR